MKEEDRNNNNELKEEQKSSDVVMHELLKPSDDELKQIIENHKLWLETDGKEGKKEDLVRANLQKADLVEANLQKADLFGADLQKAKLGGANLQKAKLGGANLQKADLVEANLQKADLCGADLQKTKLGGANLQKAKLGGANLQKADLVEANLQKADLCGADLQKTKLGGANLQKAILFKANLQKANLRKANLRKSNLRFANLQHTNLYNTTMQKTVLDGVQGLNESNLQYANLENATGLLGNEFAQADVTGTKLPDGIKDFKALEIVKETSQNARKVFFAMLLGCVYSWLTISTTTDVRLLTNTASSPLPIIGTEIPIAGFYIVAPLVLICLYFYFHLYLIKLWEALSGLPAIFPDGKRLDEIAYPWLLNGLGRRHFRLLKIDRPFIAHVQEWITIMLAWWVVPITMIAFWLRYIRLHDWRGTSFHIGLIVVSFSFAIIFYRLCALTLKSKKSQIFRLKDFLKDKRFYYGVIVVLVGFFFILLSYGTIEGVRTKEHYFSDIKKFVPWAFEKLGYGVFVNFREQRVTEIPPNIGAISKEERLEFVKGANLKGRNLIYADLSEAFMVKADLRRASLNYAILKNTNLQQADLRETDLQEADLGNANLKQANLSGAKLQQTNLGESELQNCIFERANLQQADLRSANLKDAYLWDANLKQAKFGNAILQNTEFVRANLQEVNLWNANLEQADLRNVNLKDAYLWGALFINANLTGANNLTIDQVSKVKTLYQTKLDPDLLEQVKKCCPHLLEEPKKKSEQTK